VVDHITGPRLLGPLIPRTPAGAPPLRGDDRPQLGERAARPTIDADLTMPTLSDQLRERIIRDGRSLAAIAREAGIERAGLWRFMRGDHTITLETADRLAAVLGLQLTDAEPERSHPS